ncbi:MAG TPA: zinc-dependent metalloprotease family protein [Edaphocola sp.]|nr:zinc-dependent metalloprotease family protein [Edaphocola sp.]
MKKLFTWIIAGACTLCLTPTFGQSNFWTVLKGHTAPTEQPMSVKPSEYQLLSLRTGALKDLLAKAGNTYETGVLIDLPGPDHTMIPFKVWSTPMMEKPLADKYPQIHTYTAASTENPGISAKLDFTDYGFRAAIYNNNEIFLIDPYSNVENGYYIAFNAGDLPDINKNFSCDINQYPDLISPKGAPVEINGGSHQTANKQNGAVRHNYRLALACTGEYAILVTNGNPTPALVLQKIVSTVNRINGIYERELSVTFTLVGNEDSLVFTDPNTDPYTCNYNMNCLLNENQTTVTSIIGDANYDIGHIFCTAGGGLATLFAVCNSSRKAEGASTSSGPDDFSTALHEMGHEFSARHTFNATTGGCYQNIDTSSSYEPGSGSTIMSYGGLCDPNNIVFISDKYFNVASLNQMHDYIINSASGTGCGTSSAGLNSVSIPSSLNRTYNIPKSTPFELVAPEITPSQANASISYTWEQYDLGNFGGTEADDGDAPAGPTMRSYPPTDSGNIRTFPIDKILDGSYTGVGERLSTTARTLHFKLTARSILQGWGSLALMDSSVTVKVSGQGPFRVTAPASNATFDPGDTVTVKWNVSQTTQAPVSCHAVNIYLSMDGGQSFPILLMGSTDNDGEAKVVLPNVYTTKGRIKVQGVSNIFYDVAKGKLSINGTNGIAETFIRKHTKIFPNPATNIIHLEYTAQSNTHIIVNMYDMSGRLTWSGKMISKLDIPVATFARGQYQIQLINGQAAASVSYAVSLQ